MYDIIIPTELLEMGELAVLPYLGIHGLVNIAAIDGSIDEFVEELEGEADDERTDCYYGNHTYFTTEGALLNFIDECGY